MKKISILALHLGFGGVEQAVINQANMLCNDYKVKLIVTYKLSESPAFFVDPKVEIKYLIDSTPNKADFLLAIKTFRISKILKEGIKSIKILYLKKHTMKKYILNSKDDVIISSRISITKLLNKYGKTGILIAEEHRHHNNNKRYIKSLVRACKRIDYLLCVSKELTLYYSKLMKNAKCVYMPNSLSNLPKTLSKLNNKRIISVGRLSKEKGYLDLVDVFKLIHDIDSEFSLDIVGDGNEYTTIKNRIEELNLKNSVTLHGFQHKPYIDNLLRKSSIYLMCSFEESFGIVLIEAASFGIPQIAFSSAQGAKEIIEQNKSGILIENRNKEEMAKMVIDLYNNAEKKIKYGKQARNIAETFSFETVKEKWLDFLNDALTKK